MRHYLLTILLLTLSLSVFSQDALKKANQFMEEEDYRSALLHFSQIPNIENSGPILFKRAICYYEINEIDKAVRDISSVESIGFKSDNVLYYQGRLMHHKGNFKKAAEYYKQYLREVSMNDFRRSEVKKHLRHCGSAMDILYIDPIATIENAGKNINSAYDDTRLVQSTGKTSRFYYTSNRPDRDQKVSKYLSKSYKIDASSDTDIYFSDRINDALSKGEKLGDNSVNTYKNDKLVDLSMDGGAMYILRGKEELSLEVSGSSAQTKRRIKLLQTLLQEDEDLYFFNDSTVVFSSKRFDGQGGYDIFVTAFVNDNWLAPKNLGREINTSADEVSPYITNDGETIYFSSDRPFSVGGLDIFISNYLFEQDKWNAPKNIGIPINSPGDETHYRLSQDGLLGTYTSNRRDGYGQSDIYLAFLNERSEHQDYAIRNLSFIDYPDFYTTKEDVVMKPSPEEVVESSPSSEVPVVTNTYEAKRATTIRKTKSSKITLPILVENKAEIILTKENHYKLDDLAQVLSENDFAIEIMSFSHKEGIAEYNLFRSIKNAEQIKELLVEKGAPAEKLFLKGYGNFLPIIKSSVEDRDITRFNNRIEFKINLPDENIVVENEVLDINKSYLNRGYDIFRTLIDDAISYKIQIATVRQMYRGTALKAYNDVQVEKDSKTGNYLYSVGLYDNFLEANLIMRELSERGLTALKIVPYVDGLRVEEKDLVNYASEYPELKEYIRSMSYTETEEE